MKTLLRPRPLPAATHLSIAALRIAAGVALVHHSLPKLDNPTAWMPGETFPSWALAFAAYGELLGGAALALGLATPIAALVVLGVMAGAVYHHVGNGDPFVATKGGAYELASLHLGIAFLVLTTGPGAISLDQLLFARKPSKPD
ncbi:MAG: DoxX family protein [Planctomycetes bacterium]|nr:DoxX family protein [Planctomycetota bacterium]